MRRYELKIFVRYLTNDLLEQYLKSRQIPFDPNLDTEEPQTVETYVISLEEELQNQLHVDFAKANEMSSETGILALVGLAQDSNIELQRDFETLESHHCRALHTLIKHPDLFEEASILHYVEDLTGKTERKGIARVTLDEPMLAKRATELEQAVRTYLMSKEGRGNNCRVEIYPYKDFICFLAYTEDYLKPEFQFVRGNLKRVTIKPVFEIVWVYYPTEGKIELKSKYGGEKELELFKMFAEIVLDDTKGIDEKQTAYKFNKILEEDFNIYGELEDNLEWLYLSDLRLNSKYSFKEQVILRVEKADGDGMSAMREALKYRNINKKHWKVTQATFRLKFEGKGNKGSVTMRISNPDKCNLTTTPTHLKAKKYLKLWNLENNHE